MKQRINIAELLKDCPKGMELYSPMLGVVYFDKIVDTGHAILIKVTTSCNCVYEFYSDGKYNTYYTDSEITLFPSKEQRDWSKFQRPFKDGDVLVNKNGTIFINAGSSNGGGTFDCYCYLSVQNEFCIEEHKTGSWLYKNEIKPATKEEKEKLFDAIKSNGYKWNEETKTLDKLVEPKFKVGDRIRHKTTNKKDVYEISKVYEDSYGLVGFTWMIYMKYQDQYELVPNKFDINTLKPFDSKVLVRDTNDDIWRPAIYGFETNSDKYYIVGGVYWKQCIPYKGNEHLLGTTDDCDDYYKTWEE